MKELLRKFVEGFINKYMEEFQVGLLKKLLTLFPRKKNMASFQNDPLRFFAEATKQISNGILQMIFNRISRRISEAVLRGLS